MERYRSTRISKNASESPPGLSLHDDEKKVHKQPRSVRTMLRMTAVRWRHLPFKRLLVTWKVLLLGFLIAGILRLGGSENFASLDRVGLRKSAAPESPRVEIRKEKILLNVGGEQIMKDAGYLARPRTMGFYFEGTDSDTYLGAQQLDPNLQRRQTHNVVVMTKRELKAQQHLEDSKDYRHGMADPLEEGDCVVQYEWQKTSYPTCNSVHEQDLTNLHAKHNRDAKVRILSNGYWRDVWKVRDYKQQYVVVKTIRYEHDYEERNYDRHRRDSVAMEHLTASRNVMDIFGFCGNSGIFEFAPGGDIEFALWYNDKKAWNNTERVLAAYQVALGIADLHNVDKEGRSSIAHTDITTSQFVYVNGHYKLNDFNRCRFLTWNQKTNEVCPFYVGNNPGNFRAPEEYAYEGETEKVDIYSMGNVFYTILTENWPFEHEKDEKAQKKIMRGERPVVPEQILNSTEPEHKILLKAMEMSWVHDPKKRASAREVATYLKTELRNLRAPKTLDEP